MERWKGTSRMEMESKGQKGEGRGRDKRREESLCSPHFRRERPSGVALCHIQPPSNVATLSFLSIQITGTVALEGRKREKEKASEREREGGERERERRSGGDDGGGDGNGGTRLLDRGGRADRG